MVYVTMLSGYGTSQSFKRSLGGTVDQMGERCSTGDSRRGNRKSIVIVREGEATLCRVRVVRKWYSSSTGDREVPGTIPGGAIVIRA